MSHKMMTHQLGGLDPTLNQMSQPFASNGIQLLQRRGNRPTSVTPPNQRHQKNRNDFGVSFQIFGIFSFFGDFVTFLGVF